MANKQKGCGGLFSALAVLCALALLNIVLVSPDQEARSQTVHESLTEFRGANTTAAMTAVVSKKTREVPSDGTATITKTSTIPSESLSACLLIKDDNDILNEWIAYHYHTLGLRYLLVAVDPSSQTSPSALFKNWENVTKELQDPLVVTEWSDPDFMPQDFLEKGYHIPPRFVKGNANESKWHEGHEDEATVVADQQRINNHRFRQVTFLSSCLKHMRNQSKTWTIHIDTDEYVVVNPLLRSQKDISGVPVPDSPKQPSCLIDMLRKIYQKPGLRKSMNHPCISVPRLLFGSIEKEENMTDGSATTSSNVLLASSSLRPLETLRWKYHTAFDDTERNAQPKVIVDVSKVPLNDEMFRPKPFSIHRPSKALCRRMNQLSFRETNKYPLTANHYLGSWERYYYARNDTRRSRRVYDLKSKVQDGRDDWIVPWLDGFVENVGLECAQKLLDF